MHSNQIQQDVAPIRVTVATQNTWMDIPENGTVASFDEKGSCGFIRLFNGLMLWFQLKDGVAVVNGRDGQITFDSVENPHRKILSAPVRGDRIMFVRGTRSTDIRFWCYSREYKMALEANRETITLGDARRYLSGKECRVLQYTEMDNETTRRCLSWYATTAETAEKRLVAYAELVGSVSSRENDACHGSVSIFPDDPRCKRGDLHDGAWLLCHVGIQTLTKGVCVAIRYNNHEEVYVVDRDVTRPMTRDERQEKDAPPLTADKEWLRCSYAKKYGGRYYLVKVLRHLGGRD